MALDRSFSDGVAIRYVLPVLRITSCLHIMARNRRHKTVYFSSTFVLLESKPGDVFACHQGISSIH